MGIALQKLAQEDPSFRVSTDEESGQTIISGMGELHLDIIVDRMRASSRSRPMSVSRSVAYRETIRQSDRAGRQVRAPVRWSWSVRSRLHSHRAAGAGQRATSSSTRLSAVSCPGVHPAVDKGVQEQMQNGVIAGYPVVDVKVTLYDGSYHDVDSSEMAFKIAGSMAFKEGARRPTRCCSSRS